MSQSNLPETFRLLIVEDSENDLLLMVRHIRQSGLQPEYTRVDTQDEFTSALKRQDWDLIITDYLLPGFDALEALRIVRQSGLDIPCIVVSGKITEEIAVSAMRSGARDFITKDNLNRLVPVIERELQEARSRKELQKVETQLIESEKRFQMMVETAGEGVWVTDERGLTTFVNRRMAEMLGYETDELMGKPVMDYCAPEYRETCLEASSRISRGERQSYEAKFYRKDGQIIWVGVNGTPLYSRDGTYIGALGLYTDITENKLSQKKLLESEQQLQALFENMTEGVVLLDVDGRVLKINPVAGRILRLNPEQIPGSYYNSMHWTGEVTLSDGTVLSRELLSRERLSALGRMVVNEEASLQFPDGSTLWLRGSITPLEDSAEGIRGIIVTFSDITGEKIQQEQLTQKLLETQEAERKRIALELHDDTAQSLSLISLELDSLASSGESCSDKIMVRLKSLKSAVDRTLQEVRRFSHELHPAVLDHLGLIPALEQLVEETRERDKLLVELAVQGQETKLPADKELALFRIAQEGLNNIRKHAQATRAKILLHYYPGYVRLQISDNGKGFEVSRESKSAIIRGSLGILSMKERAHLVKANLKIESKLNQGTIITVDVKTE